MCQQLCLNVRATLNKQLLQDDISISMCTYVLVYFYQNDVFILPSELNFVLGHIREKICTPIKQLAGDLQWQCCEFTLNLIIHSILKL